MDYGPIYCAVCGLRVDSPGRTCPKCGEPLPAPPTVIGYGDPSQPPESQPREAGSSVFGTSPLAMTPFPSRVPAPPPPAPAPIDQDAQPPAPAPIPQEQAGPAPAPPPAHLPLPPPIARLPATPEQLPPKPGTEQTAPAPSALQSYGVAPTVPDRDPMPEASPRPRNRLAGGLLTIWGVVLLIAGLVFSGIHLMMVLEHGFWNLHDALHAALWVSVALLPVALLQLAAGVSNLLGRLAPRAQALVALLAQAVWAIAAVLAIHASFMTQGPALLIEILAGGTILPSLVGAILAWVAARPRTMVYAPGP